MTNLRKQLQNTRQVYEAMHYPGDLVADVRRPAARRLVVRWVLGLSASAALIAISVSLYSKLETIAHESPSITMNPINPEIGQQVAEAVVTEDFEFAPPSMPEGMSMAPSFSLSAPSGMGFSSFDTTGDTTSPTTKESI